ncbi:hypothetical protein SAMN05216421_1642 [Halopseudomonas xinjiangensis]|uniref:Alpha/beta hydrolase family protein n=1 Tax=Halopseudomonas xinjiangensis TaxID=487184 RepID=A0A1H1SS05_9GAMM|nr:alpha/beta hydrolase [Halopseudomonas xinjiangensis]SDS50179.1 hypothetical protein SAMN05216421_1642 [Halopseudomonas xinjiangensis]
MSQWTDSRLPNNGPIDGQTANTFKLRPGSLATLKQMPSHRFDNNNKPGKPGRRLPMQQSPLSTAIRASILLSAALGLSACIGGDSSNDTPPAVTQGCGGSDNAVTVNEMCVERFVLPSEAKAANTPGTAGVAVSDPKLLTHLGADADLNKALYVRYALAGQMDRQPDAILVVVPGTLGGSHNYLRLAENLMARAAEQDLVVEIWGFERRSTLLEDTDGLDIAEREGSPELAVNFLYGDELGLELPPELDRRAVFYDQADAPFMASWSPQVHSFDIDAVVERARETARNGNVFLGGHSAGAGFVTRYAATDFNLSYEGAEEPGYAKLRGMILFEGTGSSVASTPPDEADLDAVIAAADGGLYAASVAGAPAYINAPGLGPRQVASTEVSGLQMAVEETINGSQSLLQRAFGADLNGRTNNVYQQVANFSDRPVPVTAGSSVGTFQDDDNSDSPVFYAISIGAPGSLNAEGLLEWLDNDQPLPPAALNDNGPALTSMLTTPRFWGQEVEPTNLGRLTPAFYAGQSNFSDWYYPSTGLLLGNSDNGGANLGLDTSALSLPVELGGRGRADIVNQTQARSIDVPVIAFGGSNGLAPLPGSWRGIANSIAPCAAQSCRVGTPRMLSGATDFSAFPQFGGVEGGFEVYISEGYSHNDVLTADDDATNNVIGPLLSFIERNAE